MYIFCNFIFSINLANISSNVLGNWRFAVADEGLRSKTSNRKMWRRKTAQRRLRRLRFCGARTAEQAVSSYRLLYAVVPYSIIFYTHRLLFRLHLLYIRIFLYYLLDMPVLLNCMFSILCHLQIFFPKKHL